MKTSIPHLITIWLIVAFSVLTMEKAFSQTDQENGVEATSSKNDSTITYVTGLTSARARSLVGGVIGLISLIVGWRVKSRPSVQPGRSRSWAITALGLGFIAIILSVVHLANVTGGFGTGGGKAGAIVALVLGLIGTSLSGLALCPKRSN